MRRKSAGLALLTVIAAAAWLAVALVDAPEPVPATAPEEVFSAGRALPHVQALAQGPRPLGTEAHARARRYIQDRLRDLGLEPRLQVATGRSRWGRAFGAVRNVLVRLPGSESPGEGPAVLLMAHYDSVPQSPGASDDAVGVAVLLETLRALRANPPLRHDVVALFSDGEEAGLLGAEAFAHDHPWAEDVAVVLNFEARGTRGPALMFETGAGNRWVVEHFAGAPHPVAASYSYEVYRRLPNDTDFSIFRGRGVPGLNFAHIHGPVGYHTVRDTVERLDPASLQHHGANALALARAFSESGALGGGVGGGDAVYFNPLGEAFVWFPASWVPALVTLAVVATLGVLGLGLARRRLRFGGLVGAVALWLAVTVLAGALAAVAAGWLLPGRYDFQIWGDGSSVAWTLFAVALLALGVVWALQGLVRRWLAFASLAGGGLLLWAVAAVAVSLAAPGASYLFLVPLAAQGVAVGRYLGRRRDGERVPEGEDRWDALSVTLWGAAGAVTALVWAPTLALVAVGLQAAAVSVVSALVALLLGLLAPQVDLSAAVGGRRWVLPAGVTVVGLALLVAVRASSGYGPQSPRPTSLFYAQDADTGEALWASFEGRPSDWSANLLPPEPVRVSLDDFLGSERPLATGPAPELDLATPELHLLEAPALEGRDDDGGRYRLRVLPPAGAHRLRLFVGPAEDLRAVEVEGRAADLPEDPRERVAVVVYAPPAEGVELALETGGGPPRVEAVAQWFGLPTESQGGPPPREAHLMPVPFGWDTDTTMVRKDLAVRDAAAGAEGALEATEGEAPAAGEAAAGGSERAPSGR